MQAIQALNLTEPAKSFVKFLPRIADTVDSSPTVCRRVSSR